MAGEDTSQAWLERDAARSASGVGGSAESEPDAAPYRDLFVHAPAAQLIWERAGGSDASQVQVRLVAYNVAARPLLRANGSAARGALAREALHPDLRESVANALAAGLTTGEVQQLERLELTDGVDASVYVGRVIPLPAGRVALIADDLSARVRTEELYAVDLKVLDLLVAGTPMREVLDALVRGVETLAKGMRGTILFVEDGRVRHGAAPDFPGEYVAAIDGQAIGPGRGSCGTAAYLRKPVIVEDIATDPSWTEFRDVALRFGLRACWSVPIFGANQALLGTFAFYYQEPRRPTDALLDLIGHASRLAAVAIERVRATEALEESEARSRAIVEHALDANIIMGGDGIVSGWNSRAGQLFGWSAGEALGHELADMIIPEKMRAAHRRGLRRYLETRESGLLNRRIELAARHRDGHEFPVELAITPFTLSGQLTFSAFLADITQRKHAESLLREAQRHLSLVYDHVEDLLFQLTVEGPDELRFAAANPAFYRVTGLGAQRVIGRLLGDVISDPASASLLRVCRSALASGTTVRVAEWMEFAAGERLGDIAITPVHSDEGAPQCLIASIRDITDSRRMEDEMRQLQRLEALGRLTGGVAHDFNNILAVIGMYAESIQRNLRSGDPLRSDVEEILKAGRRATALTRQLLAFGRKQTLQPRVLDLNQALQELEPMLRRLIREDVRLSFVFAKALWRIEADPGQLEQVVINLAVNARDAMPDGGELKVETANVTLHAADARTHPDLVPGEHVMLTVTDTGCGMDEDTKRRIFEPFFTTKESDRGTGLGLATVYGIVKQSGGSIWVYSEPAIGTTFKIYFPRTNRDPIASRAASDAPVAPRGEERILLVEDEPALRDICARMLRELRYSVMACASPGEALRSAEEHGHAPNLLLTDVVMPEMSGKKLAERIRARLPNLPVLYMSGYTDNTLLEHGELAPNTTFLEKPFTLRQLEAKVRATLQQASEHAQARER